jgi:hypothetical protein
LKNHKAVQTILVEFFEILYSDYDEEKEGCNDANQDKICDKPKKIGSGPRRG